MRATIIASMRNEGPFIVEWVVWHRMLGFTDVVVLTNDCTDHSPQLLDCLAGHGLVEHVPVAVPPGAPVTATKLEAARGLTSVRRSDWVMVADVDEFLVVHRGGGRLADLLGAGDPAFLGMAVNWRVFGSGGIDAFEDLPVHQQFFTCVAAKRGINSFVKTLFRRPKWWARFGEHGPQGLNLKRAGQPWGAPGMAWVDAEGHPVAAWQPEGPYLRMLPDGARGHAVAQINHYMLRSAESYSLKAGTLSPVAGKNRYTNSYWITADRAEETDTSALRHAEEFQARQAAVMDLSEVARLHRLCVADHLTAIAHKAGRDPGADTRITAALAAE